MKPESVALLRLAPHGFLDLREEAEKDHGLDEANAHRAATAVADMRRRIREGVEDPDVHANPQAHYRVLFRQVFTDNLDGVSATKTIELAKWATQRVLIPDED